MLVSTPHLIFIDLHMSKISREPAETISEADRGFVLLEPALSVALFQERTDVCMYVRIYEQL
jgi:hypothetical protein